MSLHFFFFARIFELSVTIPLVVSLSRMRKVPLALPLESSCLSASFRPNLPKYQLRKRKTEKQDGLTGSCCAAVMNTYSFLTFSLKMQAVSAMCPRMFETHPAVNLCFFFVCVCACVCAYACSFTQKERFYSLLGLDRVHWSDIITGNITSSTCGERTGLPPVSLTGGERKKRRFGIKS